MNSMVDGKEDEGDLIEVECPMCINGIDDNERCDRCSGTGKILVNRNTHEEGIKGEYADRKNDEKRIK